MKNYHKIWLEHHPLRSEEWLQDKLKDGFHIHHIDCNHENNMANNLMLVEASDHFRLHERFDISEAMRLGKQTKKLGVKLIKAAKEGREMINEIDISSKNSRRDIRSYVSLYPLDSVKGNLT